MQRAMICVPPQTLLFTLTRNIPSQRLDSPLAIEATRQSPEHCWTIIHQDRPYLVDSDTPDSELVQGVITEMPDLTAIIHRIIDLEIEQRRMSPFLTSYGLDIDDILRRLDEIERDIQSLR